MSTVIHSVLFIVGSAVLCYSLFRGFIWASFLPGFPSAGGLVAAYFWIRQDIWRSDARAKNSEDVSRRADSRIAFLLLFLIAIAQGYSSYKSGQVGEGNFFVGMILIGVPMGHWTAPFVDRAFSWVIRTTTGATIGLGRERNTGFK